MAANKKTIYHLCLICVLILSGCKFPLGPKGPDEVEATADERSKTKLLKRIQNKFENPQAHFELGQFYQKDGLWAQAEHEYSIALSFDPVHREAQAARIKVLMDGGDNTKAELLVDEYTSQASTSALGSLKFGLALQEYGLDEYALNCYQQALRLAPNSARVNRQIGYYHLSKNDKIQARGYLSRSFDLDPMQPEVAGELGRLGVSIKIPTTTVDAKKLDKTVDESVK